MSKTKVVGYRFDPLTISKLYYAQNYLIDTGMKVPLSLVLRRAIDNYWQQIDSYEIEDEAVALMGLLKPSDVPWEDPTKNPGQTMEEWREAISDYEMPQSVSELH